MRRFFIFLVVLAGIAAIAGWDLTSPNRLAATDWPEGDAVRGEGVFWAAGCISCHAAPGAEGEDRLVLAGGVRLSSPFGTFVAPSISPSEQGIGGWSVDDLGNALKAGVSPEGAHYYPSLPYTTYARMRAQDVADLKAFLDTLPPSDAASQPHEIGFPFNIRRGLGLWKQRYLDDGWIMPAEGEQIERGRYLVEALGHCGECHTPRDRFGGLDRSRWLQGAPHPSGKGEIPGIAPGKMTWSAEDIAYYLESGFTPDFDSAGGEMADVIANMAQLTGEDRAAIAAYVKAVPGSEGLPPLRRGARFGAEIVASWIQKSLLSAPGRPG